MKQALAFLAAMTLLAALGIVAASRSLSPPQDFAAELEAIKQMDFRRDPDLPLAVVTGSSSVRLWQDPGAWLGSHQVVNTGFGGSTMAQLLRNDRLLITRYRPDLVYIGEGDNDIALGKRPEQILATTRRLLGRIERSMPATPVVLIAAKPSLVRWNDRELYEQLNAGFARLARQLDGVEYADVWTPLIGADGRPRQDLYRSDGLHLNDSGYVLWAAQLWRQLRKVGADGG